MMEFIWFLVIGALAGWMAGLLMRGQGFGMAGNLIVGILGAFLGGFLFRAFGYAAYGLGSSLLLSTVGAVLLLALANLIGKPRPLS